MRPRHALTSAVAVVGGIALIWCAWLVLRADLTTGTTVAAVVLWLLAAGAAATLAAYVREVERHRAERTRHRASSKPLPGLVLLWVAGLTALAVFPFMLSGPSASGAESADRDAAPVGAVDTPAARATSTPRASTPTPARTTATSPSRGSRRTSPPSSTASGRTSPQVASPRPTTTSPTSRATRTPSATTTTTPDSSTTTSSPGPLITIPLPRDTTAR